MKDPAIVNTPAVELADFAATLRFADIPRAVVDRTEDLFLDGHPPLWRFQLQGRDAFAAWLAGYAPAGAETTVVRTIPTATGFVTEFVGRHDEDAGRYERAGGGKAGQPGYIQPGAPHGKAGQPRNKRLKQDCLQTKSARGRQGLLRWISCAQPTVARPRQYGQNHAYGQEKGDGKQHSLVPDVMNVT